MTRFSGVLLPVFSLPSRHGIGDFGAEARRFADLLANHGAAAWQILPLNAGNPENGESPYFSVSAFAINPLLISLEGLQDAGLLTREDLACLPELPQGMIHYSGVRSLKWPLLEKAAAAFRGGPAFDEFCREHRHWLEDFALFDALRAEHPSDWTAWPELLRERDPQALAAFAADRPEAILSRKALQFLAWTQWQDLRAYCKSKNLTLIGDMPIYVALDSADTWANPSLFKLDAARRPIAVSGVPPDSFSADGQLWNNPVYAWDAHQKDGFAWWIRRLRHMFTLYDTVRIDHFRGLVQYWEIPAGEPTAVNGAWKDVPTREFLDALTAAFAPFPVICEDLGVITDDVRQVMEDYRLPGMRVLQFAFEDDDPGNPHLPANYPDPCLVYTGTHDNLPTCGWLKTADGKTMARIAALTGRHAEPRDMVWDLIELGMQSRASAAIFPLQDLLGMDESSRINNPARMEGNWRWRWNAADHPARAAFAKYQELAKKHGRA